MIKLIAGNVSAQHLLALCHMKNELNRRRRRFYGIAHPRYPRKASDVPVDVKAYALAGYNQAKKDMKSMTQDMRSIRVAMNAKFIWSDHGSISACVVEGRIISHKDFKKYYEAEMFETTVLGG